MSAKPGNTKMPLPIIAPMLTVKTADRPRFRCNVVICSPYGIADCKPVGGCGPSAAGGRRGRGGVQGEVPVLASMNDSVRFQASADSTAKSDCRRSKKEWGAPG